MPINHRYELRSQGADGTAGPVIVWVRARLGISGVHATFHSDGARTQLIFGVVGRTGEIGYQVTDAEGQQIGAIRKNAMESAFRSTWELSTPEGLAAVGRERSTGVAVARRVLDLFGKSPLMYHFDFFTAAGDAVLTSERMFSIRPRYQLTIPALPDGTQLDWRIGVAMAVALYTF